MKNSISFIPVFLLVIISVSICSETAYFTNLRYKRYQKVTMHLNLVRFRFGETIESVQWPLNAQLGLGTGGGSAGFGYGFAGGPDGPMKGPVQPFGFGVRLQIFKPWNVLTGRSDFIDYTKIYMGIDTTVTFLFLGVDVGYLIPQNFKTEKSFLSLGIGVGF